MADSNAQALRDLSSNRGATEVSRKATESKCDLTGVVTYVQRVFYHPPPRIIYLLPFFFFISLRRSRTTLASL